ncbi:MAG: class I SAM-dependent methyltransferase [Acidimicrobiia bacterium]
MILPWVLGAEPLVGDVLEIGSGSGAMAAAAVERFPDVRFTATDADPAMVDAATTRLAPLGDRADVRLADSTALDFADDRFDAVLSFLMLHHVLEWEQALAEVVRVVRPGGYFIGYDLLDTPPARLIHRLDGSAHHLFPLSALRAAVAGLPVETLEVAAGLGGLVARFRLRTDG